MSGQRVPTVSIGLPVMNGMPYLVEALDSILAQTYTDFELIISDNASTDETEAVCRRYAAQDARIIYHRNPVNIGGANNHNLTFRLARGKYFRWAAADDVLAPTFLERCVEVLDRDPRVAVCYSWAVVIDGAGREIERITSNWSGHERRWMSFVRIASSVKGCEEIYGLMRAEVLGKTGLQRNYTDSDRTLLAHMALLGTYHQVQEWLFYKRVHSRSSLGTYPDWRGRMVWFGDEYVRRVSLPHWRQLFHYLWSVDASPIPLRDKAKCYAFMVRWVFSDLRWRSLAKDVLIAVGVTLRRTVHTGRKRLYST